MVLSPEQRLLIEQRSRERPTAEGAARRLATNVANPDAAEDQAVASIVLQDQPPPRPQERPAEETQEVGIIDAIVGAITGSPPQN